MIAIKRQKAAPSRAAGFPEGEVGGREFFVVILFIVLFVFKIIPARGL
jgi:hypothetical protein